MEEAPVSLYDIGGEEPFTVFDAGKEEEEKEAAPVYDDGKEEEPLPGDGFAEKQEDIFVGGEDNALQPVRKNEEIPVSADDELFTAGDEELFLAGEPAEEGKDPPQLFQVGGASDSWTVSLVYYDSAVGGGNRVVYPSTPVTWTAVSSLEQRVITFQINYKNNNSSVDYSPGSVVMRVPDLATYFSGTRSVGSMQALVSADAMDSSVKVHDWSYRRRTDPNTGYAEFELTNNFRIEAGTNFEGSVQLSWTLYPIYGEPFHQFSLSASILDQFYTDAIQFRYSSTEKKYDMSKEAVRLMVRDGLPSGDYIWVKYRFSARADTDSEGVRFADPHSMYFLDTLPMDVLVLDERMNPVSPEEGSGGTYRFFPTQSALPEYYSIQLVTGECYVGYPPELYQDRSFTNTAKLYGGYYVTDACHGDHDTVKLLAQASCTIAVADFAFTYDGELYSLSKSGVNYAVNSSLIRDRDDLVPFIFGASAQYTGTPFTIRIGDDLAGILYENGDFHLFQSGEAWFDSITLPRFKNLNGAYLPTDRYRYCLYVKEYGQEEYSLFLSYTDNGKKTITFPESSHVTAWYLELENLTESLSVAGIKDKNDRILVNMRVHDENVTDTGSIYNFGYMQVYMDSVEQIEAGLANYDNELTREMIVSFDRQTYGKYQFRAWACNSFYPEINGLNIGKVMFSVSKDESNERFIFPNTININVSRRQVNSFNTVFRGFEIYDHLPLGMEPSGRWEADDIVFKMINWQNTKVIQKSNGEIFPTQRDFLTYIKNHTKLEKVANWRGSGRTWLRITVDLSDEPLDLSGLRRLKSEVNNSWWQSFTIFRIDFNTEISFDAFLEYGKVWKNRAYARALGESLTEHKPWRFEQSYYVRDSGLYDAEEMDIDGNGDCTEWLSSSADSISISDVVATHQDVTKFVQTDHDSFTRETALASCESEYTYKLRVRTGNDEVTNLVIYDLLETAYGDNLHWQGIFVGTDTSYAAQKGWRIQIFFSENPAPQRLGEDDSWQPLSSEIPPERVKALAFRFLNAQGAPAVLPANTMTYVLITMRAPLASASAGLAYNSCFTEWNALDPFGQLVYDITGINSNTVRVTTGNEIDPNRMAMITLKKRIFENEVVWAHGNPTFTFRITRREDQDSVLSFYKTIIFSGEDIAQNGILAKEISFQVPPGCYQVEEEPVMRYRLKEIQDVENGTVQNKTVCFCLGYVDGVLYPYQGAAAFVNEKESYHGLSDCCYVLNQVSGQSS